MDAEILPLEAVPENLHRDLEKVRETSTLCQLDNMSALGQCTAQQWAAPKGSGKQGYALGVGDHVVRPHCYPGLPACIPAAGAFLPASQQPPLGSRCPGRAGCLRAPTQRHGIELEVVSPWYLSPSRVPSGLLVCLCQAEPQRRTSCQGQVDRPALCWGGNASFGLRNLSSSPPSRGWPSSLLSLSSLQTRPGPPCSKTVCAYPGCWPSAPSVIFSLRTIESGLGPCLTCTHWLGPCNL